MDIVRGKPFFHLSMEVSDRYDKSENDFYEDIHEYIHRIYHCSNRLQAVNVRTNALKFIDQWRLQRSEEIDEHVRSAGQLVLNAFDECQSI